MVSQAHSTGSAPAVEAVDLRQSLPLGGAEVPILQGVSFAVQPGEWVALTGPSGSGKSTLLGIVAGLDAPCGGRILLHGIDVTHMAERELAQLRNREVGIVFQSYNLIPSLTALENVEVPLYVHHGRHHIRERATEMLHKVGLGERGHHQPHQLSGGEQQRVAIARALVTQPLLLLADEPTGNLDRKTGAQILDVFARLHDELHVTVIVATHDPQVAGRADREIHLIDGRLVE